MIDGILNITDVKRGGYFQDSKQTGKEEAKGVTSPPVPQGSQLTRHSRLCAGAGPESIVLVPHRPVRVVDRVKRKRIDKSAQSLHTDLRQHSKWIAVLSIIKLL